MDLRSPRDDVPLNPPPSCFASSTTARPVVENAPPPSVDLVVSFRAVSSLFSPSFFSSALEPNEISLEIQIRERETFTRDTRERQASISRVQKKKEAPRTFFILDLRFHVVDRVRRLHLERDRLPGQRFHENLHCVLLLSVVLFSRARAYVTNKCRFELNRRHEEAKKRDTI